MFNYKNGIQCEYGLSNARKNCSSSAESADLNFNFPLDVSCTTIYLYCFNITTELLNYCVNFQRAAFLLICNFIIKRIKILDSFVLILYYRNGFRLKQHLRNQTSKIPKWS